MAEYDPPDITYIKLALDGFATCGPECRMVKPHLADLLYLLDGGAPPDPSEMIEFATEALRREVPKLIEALAIHKRELEQAAAMFEQIMVLPIEMYSPEAEDMRCKAYQAHKKLYDNKYDKRRAYYRLQRDGKMLNQDDD